MSQYTEQWIYALQVVWLGLFAWFYGRGGIHNTAIRRYLGTGFMMLGIVGFSLWLGTFHWAYFSFWPIAAGGCTIGYGSKYEDQKVFRRFLQGLAFRISPIALAIYNHAWGAWAFQIGLAIATCIVVGAFNVFANARKNETVIAALSFALVLFLVSKP